MAKRMMTITETAEGIQYITVNQADRLYVLVLLGLELVCTYQVQVGSSNEARIIIQTIY